MDCERHPIGPSAKCILDACNGDVILTVNEEDRVVAMIYGTVVE